MPSHVTTIGAPAETRGRYAIGERKWILWAIGGALLALAAIGFLFGGMRHISTAMRGTPTGPAYESGERATTADRAFDTSGEHAGTGSDRSAASGYRSTPP